MVPATTAERLRQRAQAWLQAEIERSRKALGPSWPEHAAWVLDYLRAELAERMERWREE